VEDSYECGRLLSSCSTSVSQELLSVMDSVTSTFSCDSQTKQLLREMLCSHRDEDCDYGRLLCDTL
jgi:hypothetical protein